MEDLDRVGEYLCELFFVCFAYAKAHGIARLEEPTAFEERAEWIEQVMDHAEAHMDLELAVFVVLAKNRLFEAYAESLNWAISE